MSSLATEEKKNICVMAFGRFQPATVGHKLMIEKIRNIAIAYEKNGHKADPKIYISGTVNDMSKYKKSKEYTKMVEQKIFCSIKLNENPLTAPDKIAFMNKAYNDGTCKNIEFIDSKLIRQGNPFLALANFKNIYDRIIFLCGSDRFNNYTRMAKSIAPDKIEVRNLIRKDDTNALIELIHELSLKTTITASPRGMSGTKMRIAALKKDFNNFSMGVGIDVFKNITQEDILEFMQKIRNGIELPQDPSKWIDYNTAEFCGKWPYKWKTPQSWKYKNWRERKQYYTRATAGRERIKQKLNDKAETRNVLKLLP